MTRWLLALALALVVGPAVAQVIPPSSSSPDAVPISMVTYKGDAPHDEPWIGIMTDGTGNARVIFAAGHGGMLFMTRDNVGYLVVGRDDRVGLQTDMFSMLAVAGSGGRGNRAMIERLAGQQLAIQAGGTERVAGFEGRVYRLTLTGRGEPPHSFELVISTDPRLADAGREILRFYDQLRAPVGAVTGAVPQPYEAVRGLLALGTPLRVGPHYRLREVETRRVPASAFALPGPVLSREQLLRDLERAGMFAGDRDVPEQSGNEIAADPGNAVYYNDTYLPDDAVNDIYADNDLAPENVTWPENEAAPD